MKLTRAIPAGLIDAGLTSVATFILGLYAIATWQKADPDTLGIYFLYMTASVMASSVPHQLLFVPAEKVSLEVPPPARIAIYGRIFRLGFPVALGAAALVSFATVVGSSKGLTLGYQAPLLVTAAITAVFIPLQNHASRLLHLSGHSWAAASVSLVQVAAAGTALVALAQTSIASTWIPIGSLAIANVASTVSGALIIMRLSRELDPNSAAAAAATSRRVGYRELAPSGRWLVGVGFMSTGNNFLVESAVTVIAGAPALALAGSAKLVGQPILVLAQGLRSVLGPPSMEAAKNRDRAAARGVARTFGLLTAAAVVGYSAIAGFDWVLNPLGRVIENAYTVPGLVVLSIAANGLNGAAFPGRLELIGAGREARMFGAELLANATQLGVAVVAAFAGASSDEAGAFARPIAFAFLGLTRILGFERTLNSYYAEPAGAATPSSTIRTDLPPE
jgi:hypothetical protein